MKNIVRENLSLGNLSLIYLLVLRILNKRSVSDVEILHLYTIFQTNWQISLELIRTNKKQHSKAFEGFFISKEKVGSLE